MRNRTSLFSLLWILFASVALAACGDDDPINGNGNGGGGNGGGDAGVSTLQVTGALETSHTGIAEFELTEGESVASWELFMHDMAPSQTFSMVISIVGQAPIEGQEPTIRRPETGTYALGGETFNPEAFDVQYIYYGEDYDGETDGREPMWSTSVDGAGEFTVLESTEDLVKGSFELDVFHARADDKNRADEDSEITIKGTFTATPK